MKEETYAKKLAKMLGLDESLVETSTVEKSAKKATGSQFTAVEFDAIERYREATALNLFLEAPALFTVVKCKWCEEVFAVSRRFVAFCSYHCLKKSLAHIGIEWSPEVSVETAYVQRVWDDNEPLRVSPHAINLIKEMIESVDKQEVEV